MNIKPEKKKSNIDLSLIKKTEELVSLIQKQRNFKGRKITKNLITKEIYLIHKEKINYVVKNPHGEESLSISILYLDKTVISKKS